MYHTTLFKNGHIEDVDVRDMIKQMAMTYDNLVDTVEAINLCFSIQVI